MLEKGLIQKDLSIALGQSTRAAVGHYFTGRSEPSISQLRIIAKRLGVSLSYLISDVQDSDINNETLEYCMLLVAECAKELDYELTTTQAARLTAYMYAQSQAGQEVDTNSVTSMIRLFT